MEPPLNDKTTTKKRKRKAPAGLDISGCVVGPRTFSRVAIAPRKTTGGSISFSAKSKHLLAVTTSNYVHWLAHVTAACALRRVQRNLAHEPLDHRLRTTPEVGKPTQGINILGVDVDAAVHILQQGDDAVKSLVVEQSPGPTDKRIANAFLFSTPINEAKDRTKTVNSFFMLEKLN